MSIFLIELCIFFLVIGKGFIYLFIYLFCLHREACGILVPQPGIELVPSVVEAQNLNHWTAREFPESFLNIEETALCFILAHFKLITDF